MKGITWARDSHGLFDYESRHLTKNTMKTTNASQIVRKSNEIQLKTLDLVFNKNFDFSQAAVDNGDNKALLNIINEDGKSTLKLSTNISCIATQAHYP